MAVIKFRISRPKGVFFYFGLQKFENGQKLDFWPKMAKKSKIFKKFSKKFFFSKSIQNRSERILKRKSPKIFMGNVDFCPPWDRNFSLSEREMSKFFSHPHLKT